MTILNTSQLDDRVFWALLTGVKGIGPARLRRLIEMFGNARAAWYADVRALADAGLERRARNALIEARNRADPAEEARKLRSLNVALVTLGDEAYPARLRDITDAPPVLFVRGDLPLAGQPAIAVVGTRGATPYGRQATEKLAGDLARAGAVIVSGLARGIDAVAHQAALSAGGLTVAVLGSGLDRVYPSEHRGLADRIVGRGAVISEFPLGEPPDAGNFPRRNRIISGMVDGVLVIEADLASGALITVDFALEQGRDVYAVPGSIFSPMSRGAITLIKEGAKPVTSADDILEELRLEGGDPLTPTLPLPETDEESRLLDLLSAEPAHIDEIGRAARLPMSVVNGTLAMMELRGLARQVGGQYYVRTKT